MATNVVPDASEPFGVSVIGNKSYLVVGSGEFNVKLFAVTFEAPTQTGFRMNIRHASICNQPSPGNPTGVDHPNGGDNPITFFYAFPATFTKLSDGKRTSAGRDCSNLDAYIDIPASMMELQKTGKYGGVFVVGLTSGGNNSQQNSFTLDASSASVTLGYSQAIAEKAVNSFKALPDADKSILDFAFGSDWRKAYEEPDFRTSINVANTDVPDNATTDFQLTFYPDCTTPIFPKGDLKIRFYDADDVTGGGILQGTGGQPELWLILDRRPRDQPAAWPTQVYARRLIGGDTKYDLIDDLPALTSAFSYTARLSGLSRRNALQFSIQVNNHELLSSSDPDCHDLTVYTPPSCTISDIQRYGGGVIRPGDRIQFKATVNNAKSWRLGVNGPDWRLKHPEIPEPDITNYLATGDNFARGSPIIATQSSSTFIVDLISKNDSGMDQQMIAPGSVQNNVPFDWGFVINGGGWEKTYCTGSFNVVLEDLCLNISGMQETMPAGLSEYPSGSRSCTRPDAAPVVSITQTCDPATATYYFTVTASDPDGGVTTTYSGFTSGSSSSGSFNLTRNPEITVSLNASTPTVLPLYPRDIKPTATASLTNQGPCIWAFSLTPSSSSPALDDSEEPTAVTGVSFPTAYDNKGTSVKSITTTKQLFVYKGGAISAPYLINESISRNFTATETDSRTGPYSLTGRNLIAGDRVCSIYNLNHTSGWVDKSGNLVTADSGHPLAGASASESVCSTVVDKPYLRTYGADVVAGSGFGAADCTSGTIADIKAYTKQITGTTAGYVGAGSQFGVTASGTVSGFLSSSLTDALGNTARTNARTFSNQVANAYGGNYGAKSCSYDYWANRGNLGNGDVGSIDTLGNGRYSRSAGELVSADTTISGRIAIFVDGDISISKNITYSSDSGWASLEAIPSITIVARGNVYIAPSVSRLDGFYIAQPTTSAPTTTGRIVTCTDNGNNPSNAVLLGACRTNGLKINGAFLAEHVNFTRSKGTLRTHQTSTAPTEVSTPQAPTTQEPTCTVANPAVVYTDYNFLGTSAALAEGIYTAGTNTGVVGYRQISSVKVPAGCKVTLYDDTVAGSPSLVLTSDWTVLNGSSPFNDTTTRVVVESYPPSQAQIGFLWSHTGAIEPANYDCVALTIDNDPLWNPPNDDNMLCTRKANNLGLSFSRTTVAGKTCVNITEPGDANWTAGKNFICTTKDLGLRYSSGLKIVGMYCAQITDEPSDTHQAGGEAWWLDNYLCEPTKAVAPPFIPVTPPPVVTTSILPSQAELFTSNNLAESFNFSPDLLISLPGTKSTDVPGTFDSVVSLPPSL